MVATRLFRAQALEYQQKGGARGELVQLTPRALFWTHWALLACMPVLVGAAFVGQLDEYAGGPALVQIDNVYAVTAPRAAVVARIEVTAGERVAAGQVLMRMQSASEADELAGVERELSDQLGKLLRDPADRAAREAVLALRGRETLARSNLERQTIYAPEAGTVGDVRVRAGQLVEPGTPILTLLDEREGMHVTALLPGRYHPLLARGMTLRFIADGYPRKVHALTIERVADQAVGANEALRFLGRDADGALALSGSIVLVQARLSSSVFHAGGRIVRFHHGMQGRAEVAVRHESVAMTLVPGLRPFIGHDE